MGVRGNGARYRRDLFDFPSVQVMWSVVRALSPTDHVLGLAGPEGQEVGQIPHGDTLHCQKAAFSLGMRTPCDSDD